MANPIDVNQLSQAKGNVALTQELLTQAIEKSTSDTAMAEAAIKQATSEIASAQTTISQIQSAILTQQAQSDSE